MKKLTIAQQQEEDNKEFLHLKNVIEQSLALTQLNTVNQMVEDGASLLDIQMYLFNSWEALVNKNYKKEGAL
jgi:hypothetical protein